MAASNDLGLNLEQLLVLLKRKGIPLPFEIGAFVALQACEALGRQWGVLQPSNVWLADDGTVAVAPEQRASSEQGAARAVITLLADLLVAAAPGVPGTMLSLIERGPSSGDWTLASVRDDLEASLVPLNRGATKRVLSRLLREAQREGDRPSLRPAGGPPSQHQLDDELDALLGGPSAAADENVAARLASSVGRFESVRPPPAREDSTQQVFDDEVSSVTQPRIPKAATSLADELEPDLPDDDADADDHAPTMVAAPRPRGPALVDLPSEPTSEGRGGLWVGLALLVLTAGIFAAYVMLGKDRIRAIMGGAPPPPVAMAVEAPAKKPAIEYGDLIVTSTPDRAQVFLYAGRGPAVVEKLPMGVAHELLAIADGRAPTRALVPADAAWEETESGPRYELAMQTGEAAVPPEQWDFGATRMPANVGAPSGERGDVRVVTSPPGARVYQLIGFTPNARIGNVKLDAPLEVLVFAPGHVVERVTVDPQAFVELDGKRIAQIDVTLKPLAKTKAR